MPAGEERRQTLLRIHEAMSQDRDSYQMFYEIVPHVLRDEELQPHFRQLFEWYRRLDTWALDEGGDDRTHQPRSEPLAVLTVAMIDGLALQAIADPDLDLTPALDLWRHLVLDCVRDLRAGRRRARRPAEPRPPARASGLRRPAQPASSASAAATMRASSAAFASSSGSGT